MGRLGIRETDGVAVFRKELELELELELEPTASGNQKEFNANLNLQMTLFKFSVACNIFARTNYLLALLP